MSQIHQEAINLGDTPGEGIGTDDHLYPPQPAPNRVQQEESNYVDGSGPLFSMYVEMTGEEDKKLAESWKADADGILVFTGLFSAAVAALLAVSVQDIRPNPQDTSAFYLANIYQLLANANGSHISIPSTLSNPSSSFSPPNWAVWVNSLWFLSLAISITCALLATLLQQWARRYIKITQPRYSPHKRARIRAFFAEGVEKLHLPWAVEALPTLLHVSLFLFFSGLLIFLFNINHTIFSVVICWVGICVATYASVTFMPIFRHDSPYYAPLSTSVWLLVTGVLSVLFRILHHSPSLRNGSVHYFGDLRKRYQKWFLQGMAKVVEATARKPSSEIDNRALMWTFESLDEDHELERFFSSIPGFCSSTVVNDPLGTIIKPNQDKLLWALIGLMDRTSSSNLVPKSVKQRRSVICVKAMDAASFPLNPQIFRRVFTEEWDGLLSSLEFGLFLRKRANQSDPLSACYAQCACAIIIARVQERDDRWFDLATGQLGVSGSVIRNFLAHGDSLLLANCTYIVRQLIHAYSKHGWTHSAGSRSRTLESVSKFDMKHTLPELQHDFCALWNEVVLLARNTQNYRIQSISTLSLRHIRNAYIDLHEGTDAAPTAFSASTDIDDLALELPLSYPLCDIESHRHKVTSSIPVVVGSSEATVPVPADASSILKHDATPPTADPSSTRPDALFSFLASPSLSIPQARPLENASNSHVVLSDGVSTSPQSYTQTAIPSHVTIVNHLPVSLLESTPSVVSEAAVVGIAKNTTGAVLPTSDCISQSTALDAPAPSFPVPVHTGILPAHPQLSAFPVPQYDLTPFGQLSLSSTTSAPVFSVAARSATSIADPDSA